MKLKTFLITASLWMGLLGLTACGGADVRTYQYPETALLFDSLHIKKTVYSPGVMELYYRGGQFKDNPIRCYDANFEDLGDQFEHTFQNGVLTVQADFAEQISGLTIEDKDHDTVYHLRYLDSPQFAWLADTFWLDYGMMTLGDEARYYSDAERQAQAERERTEQSFFVPKQEIVDNGYDLSINKYKKTEYVAVEYPSTAEIMDKIDTLEREIATGLRELREMLR